MEKSSLIFFFNWIQLVLLKSKVNEMSGNRTLIKLVLFFIEMKWLPELFVLCSLEETILFCEQEFSVLIM